MTDIVRGAMGEDRTGLSSAALAPLPYHRYVATRLETTDPKAWLFCAEANRARLARFRDDTVPDDVPLAVLAALEHAAQALGVEGSLRDLLPGSALRDLAAHDDTDTERRARAGRAIARNVLRSYDDGRFGTAETLLHALERDTGTPMIYLETADRYTLATQLHGDRAATVACGDLSTALSTMASDTVFTTQEQAQTLVGRRAALEVWNDHGDADDAARHVLSPSLDLDRLDLLDRERLEWVTRSLIEDLLAARSLRTQPVLTHARRFFPDLLAAQGAEIVLRAPTPVPPDASESTRRYLAYVALDVATADPGVRDLAMEQAAQVTLDVGIGDQFHRVLAAEPTLR